MAIHSSCASNPTHIRRRLFSSFRHHNQLREHSNSSPTPPPLTLFQDNQTQASVSKPKPATPRLPIHRTHLIYMILTCLPLNIYLLRWHGSAQIAATHFIHDLGQNRTGTGPISVGVLMPCHSTPWQAYFHLPHLDEHRLWALGCEPPLGLSVYVIPPDRRGTASANDCTGKSVRRTLPKQMCFSKRWGLSGILSDIFRPRWILLFRRHRHRLRFLEMRPLSGVGTTHGPAI